MYLRLNRHFVYFYCNEQSYNQWFNFNIYNTATERVYKRIGLFDEFVMEVPCKIRSFKDLSTMIVIDKKISIGGSQSILIFPAD